MVVLNRIYTRTGDDGTTALSTGQRLPKSHIRIEAYGTVDETNACIGVARTHLADPDFAGLDAALERIQNDLFDMGADLCTPETGEPLPYEPLRIVPAQVDWLEAEIDRLNADLPPLRSFVLPAGHPAAAALHVCRTVCRRAERLMVRLTQTDGEIVSDAAIRYMNRLSDFLFVASRWVNAKGKGDVLWKPGANR
jgi:cob(I)alamin adenosyltransferase